MGKNTVDVGVGCCWLCCGEFPVLVSYPNLLEKTLLANDYVSYLATAPPASFLTAASVDTIVEWDWTNWTDGRKLPYWRCWKPKPNELETYLPFLPNLLQLNIHHCKLEYFLDPWYTRLDPNWRPTLRTAQCFKCFVQLGQWEGKLA